MELCQGYLKATKVSMLPRVDVARAQEINQLPKRPASVDDKLPMLETRSSHEQASIARIKPGRLLRTFHDKSHRRHSSPGLWL